MAQDATGWLDADPSARLTILDAAPLDAAAVRYFAPVAKLLIQRLKLLD